MSDLAIVPDPDSTDVVERAIGDRPETIPNFEGEEVTTTKAKITSVAGLEVGDRVFRMDESVKLVIEARVVGIDHKPNAQGKLERVHLLKAIDSLVIGWGMDMDALREALDS
jgi:hypothetical protein